MVYLALSYDHRIIDGADAARFLTAVKARLEEGDFEGDRFVRLRTLKGRLDRLGTAESRAS